MLVAIGLPCSALDLTTNGDFELGDFSGWEQFPTGVGQQTIDTLNPSAGQFAAKIFNNTEASNSLMKQANLGVGVVTPGQSVDISFDARGMFGIGGVAFAELFSEIDGGGVSLAEILGGGPLPLNADPEVWTTFTFTRSLGSDVSGGVTLQLGVANGAVANETSTVWFDNVSLSIEGDAQVDGDFDDNGVYECSDVDGLVAEIVAATNNADFDLNGDTLVDSDDLDAWLVEAGSVGGLTASGNPVQPGDANLSGSVDGADFVIWNANKFTNTPAWCAGDFDASGSVDGGDFVIWNSNKFQTADAISVPESLLPSWLVGLGALTSLLSIARRR
jgi:hypothetical protein